MKRQKLSSEQQEQQAAEQLQSQQAEQQALEFATPEDLLRHDAAQTAVPPGIEQRLTESTAALPPPQLQQPWWKKLFKK